MKVTKLVHSCLFVETDKINVLIDPGKYAFDGRQLSSLPLEKLDAIVITHEHQDHFYLPSIRQLSSKFPHAKIVTNNELAETIKSENFPNEVSSSSLDGVEVFEAQHEPLLLSKTVPKNIGIHVLSVFTHPGDALHFNKTCPILALPVTAPWISLKQSLERVIEIKPKKVIPVHDWHWHKEARNELYAMAIHKLKPEGIEFLALESMVSVEL